MITIVSEILTAVLRQIPQPLQIGFDPPDERWDTRVEGAGADGRTEVWANVYLADIRECTERRSADRLRGLDLDPNGPPQPTGTSRTFRSPPWVDLHYLITAWSPRFPSSTLVEHALLERILSRLAGQMTLIPSETLADTRLSARGVPPALWDIELPLQVAPRAGFAGLGDFWTAIGERHRWKPAVHLVVTAPLMVIDRVDGPEVTSLILTVGRRDRVRRQLLDREERISIGGRVSEAGAPVATATVTLTDAAGHLVATATSDEDGEFTIDALLPGAYELTGGAPNGATGKTATTAPGASTTGHDLNLT